MCIASNGRISIDRILGRLHTAGFWPAQIPGDTSVAHRSKLPRSIDNFRNASRIAGALHPVHNHRADGHLSVIGLIAALCLNQRCQKYYLIAISLE